MTRRVGVSAAVAALTVVAAALAGCASPQSGASDRAIDAVSPTTTTASPPTTANPTTSPTTARPGVPCAKGNETSSFAPPPGPPPAPGAMPPLSRMNEIYDNGAGKIRVGVDDTSLFLSSKDEQGNFVGFEAELARKVARAIFPNVDNINTKIDFVPVNTEKKFKVVADGDVDLMISVATMACDRWQDYNFSSPYYQAFQQLMVRQGSQITTQADLSGQRVCVTEPSSSLNLLTALNNEARADITIVKVPTRPACLIKLQDGKVDAIVLPSSIMAGLFYQDQLTLHRYDIGLHDAKGNASTNTYGIVLPKKDIEFTRFVNALLEQWRADGTLRNLQDDELQGYLPTVVPPVQYWPEQ